MSSSKLFLPFPAPIRRRKFGLTAHQVLDLLVDLGAVSRKAANKITRRRDEEALFRNLRHTFRQP